MPGGIASPPGSGGSTGNVGNSNSAAAAAAAAARRGNRRLTRNESRYHSGEYNSNEDDIRDTRTVVQVVDTHIFVKLLAVFFFPPPIITIE